MIHSANRADRCGINIVIYGHSLKFNKKHVALMSSVQYLDGGSCF
jgi:hypothetical protein